MKKIIESFSEGLLIGIIIAIMFNLINGSTVFYASNPSFYHSIGNDLFATIISFFAYGLIGVLSHLSSRIFYADVFNNSMISKIVVHYSLLFISVSLINAIIGNIIFRNIYSFIIYVIIFTSIYAIVYLLISNSERKKAENMMNKIKENNRSKNV